MLARLLASQGSILDTPHTAALHATEGRLSINPTMLSRGIPRFRIWPKEVTILLEIMDRGR